MAEKTIDTTTRLLYFKGEATIGTAATKRGGTFEVTNGRCLYTARLEIVNDDNPEITDNKFGYSVTTTWSDVYYQKGLGGGKRGASDDPITFEQLAQNATAPSNRAKASVPNYLAEMLDNKMEGRRYNLQIRVYSEFDGTWQSPKFTRFDEDATFQPLVKRACQEIADLL
ncbi:hypothetical protein COV16_01685 [Candidatus Woesearchaeota archaeon CG10_big_fil_rev_8_21_14_0_10_34_8]|nr:MAG: hypothetical protein COV16_01685 [Candidatus Woesearchaeota archaeon CG10_big_fil_rev_8_21_14_0_10_34_8]